MQIKVGPIKSSTLNRGIVAIGQGRVHRDTLRDRL